jgi:hypothetical protein
VIAGGVEALHQLVYTANSIEPGVAALCYWPFSARFRTPDRYRKYQNPEISCGSIPRRALVVLPEIYPELANVLPHRCALWWLSVDNFGAHRQRDISRIDLHLCQSHYAWEHTVGLGDRLMLTDWVEVETVTCERVPRVVVNPAKDAGLMKPALEGAPFDVVRLTGLSESDAAKVLWSSMVYVDFGHHPGRDRIPREAALAGCAVLSTRLGAAKYVEDMPLPNWSFFDSVEELRRTIDHILAGELDASESQSDYKNWVIENRNAFEGEVRELLQQL